MSRRRRGHGEGSVSERPDGRWHVRVDLGRGLDGKRRTKHAYAATQGEATDLLRRLGGRAVDGQLLSSSTPTLATYLEEWYETHRDEWRPSTQRSYRGAIDLHLTPAFGPIRLEQLSPQVVQRWLLAHKKQHGARRRITLAHAALRSALTSAKQLQLVSINAAELVTVPQPTTRASTVFTVDQARTFLEAAKTHRLGALFSVALACGLRLGEATGLRWEDVDLDTGTLRIHQQLQWVTDPRSVLRRRRPVLQPVKTKRSRRTLTLPAVCVADLRTHRTRQLEERLKAGPRWTETGLVFSTYRTYRQDKGLGRKVGAPLHPKNTTRVFQALLTAAQLPKIRFHDLRHSAASLLLAAGVQLAEVSMLLGHSELRITADLYGHLQQQTAAKAAGHMDAILTR